MPTFRCVTYFLSVCLKYYDTGTGQLKLQTLATPTGCLKRSVATFIAAEILWNREWVLKGLQ